MRTVFIGDIHGCGEEFAELLQRVDFRMGRDRLLLAGDAFSRGPNPLQVWEMIQQLEAQMVLGNHDESLIKRLNRGLAGKDPRFNKTDQQFTLEQLLPVADALLPWLQGLPLYIKEKDFLLVHAGMHPEKGLKHTSRDVFLNLRTWPPTEDISAPRWHDFYVPKKRLLVFGHDSLGGLVIKRRSSGKPYLVGLDTGCVHGGRLTAYVLEEDRIAQVLSRQR